MARSGSFDFTENTDQIIEDAYQKLGILAEGESLTGDQKTRAKRSLNRMVKHWQTQGVHLWKYREGTLFLEKDKSSYLLGATGDNATLSFVETALAADASSGVGTITVDDDTGISNGDNIGIELDDDTIQWTTVNGAPVANVITLTANLTGDAATDNKIYTYTNKIQRPLKITDARLKIDNGNEIPMTELARQEYFIQPNKSTTGQSTQWYYNPLLDNGKIYLWPTPANPRNYVNFTFYPDFEDFDTALNNADFPVEWLDAIVYNLSERIGLDEGLAGTTTFQRVQDKAFMLLDEAKGFDNETVNVNFTPYNMENRGWQ